MFICTPEVLLNLDQIAAIRIAEGNDDEPRVVVHIRGLAQPVDFVGGDARGIKEAYAEFRAKAAKEAGGH